MEYFSRKNYSQLSEIVIKKLISVTSSIHTIYFMLSSHSTASMKIEICLYLSNLYLLRSFENYDKIFTFISSTE